MKIKQKCLSLLLALTMVTGTAFSTTAFAETDESNAPKTIYVDASGDASGDGTEENPYQNLPDAITAAADDDTVKLQSDLEGLTSTIKINKAITIDGNSHTLSFTNELNTKGNGEQNGLLILSDKVTVESLTIQMSAGADEAESWQGVYGIQVYKSSDVTLGNVTAAGGDGGIFVNDSAVMLDGDIDVSDNEFGGIEVSNGSANLTLAEGTEFSGTFGENQPPIWVDSISSETEADALAEAEGYFTAEDYGWSAEYKAPTDENGSQVWFTQDEEEPPTGDKGTLQVAASVIGEKITVSYQAGGETKTATNGEELTDIPEGTPVTATVDISEIRELTEHKEYYTIDGTEILLNGLPGVDGTKVNDTTGTFTFTMPVEEEPITVSAAVGTQAIDGKFPVKVDQIDGGYLFAYTESDDDDEYAILPIGKEVLVPADASVSVEFYPDYRQIDSENQEIELKGFTTRVGSETDTEDEEDTVEITAPTVITGEAEYVEDEDKEPGSYWLASTNEVKRLADIKEDRKVCDLKLRQEKETGNGYKPVESPSLTFKIEDEDDGDLFEVDESSRFLKAKDVNKLEDGETYRLTIAASVDGEEKVRETIGINLSFPGVVYNYYLPTSPSALNWSYPYFEEKHIDSRKAVDKDFVNSNKPVISLYDENGNTAEKADWLYYEDKESGELKEFDIDDFDSLNLTDTDDLWLYAAFEKYIPEAGALEDSGDHDTGDNDNDDNDHDTNSGGSGSGSSGRGGHTVIVSGTAPDNKPVVTVGNDPQGKPVVTVGARPLPNAKPLTAADIAKKAADGTLNETVNPNGVWDGRTVGAKNIALVIDTKEAALATGGSYRLGVSAFAGPAGSKLRVRASRDGFVTITTNPDGTYTITANRPVSGLYILVEILDANGNVVGHSSMKLDAAAGLASKQVQNKAATIA